MVRCLQAKETLPEELPRRGKTTIAPGKRTFGGAKLHEQV